jgi:hypothetical protein
MKSKRDELSSFFEAKESSTNHCLISLEVSIAFGTFSKAKHREMQAQ